MTQHLIPISTMDLLRFTTAGSVDDGKSTLIGRLLLDTKTIFEDQLAGRGAGQPAARRGVRRPGAVHRRPARRARAAHHHRRGLSLLRHAQAQVHHRRHPRPHPVHAQHGHRRLHGRAGHHPDRRAARRAHPVQAPRLHRLAAADPARPGGGQQDGPGGLRPGGLRRHRGRVYGFRQQAVGAQTSPSSPSRRCWATTWCSAASTCPGTTAPRCCITWSTSAWAPAATWWTSVSRCRWRCGPTTASAALPARSPRAPSRQAKRWWCLPSGRS